MKISHYHKIAILIVILFSVIAGYCLMLRQPLARESSLNNQHHTLMKKYLANQQQVTSLLQLRTQLNHAIKRHQQALSSLEHPLKITAWLHHLSLLATQHAIQIESIKPANKETPATHSFNLRFTGSYFNLIHFIQRLMQPPYIITFSSIILTANSPHSLECQAQIKDYHHE